jgi:hypothetical protein
MPLSWKTKFLKQHLYITEVYQSDESGEKNVTSNQKTLFALIHAHMIIVSKKKGNGSIALYDIDVY